MSESKQTLDESTKGLDTLKDAGGLVEDAGETIRDYAKTAVDPEGIGEAVEGHLGQVNDYVEAVGGIAGEAVEGVMEVSQEIGEAATEISGAVIENFGEVSQDIVEGFENLESARDNILQGNIGESFGNISDGISNIVDGAQDLGKLGIEAIGEAVEGAAEITSEAVEAVGEIGREAIEAVPDIVENYINPSNSQDALENEQNLSQLPETLEKAQEAELQMQDSPLVERMGQAQETLEQEDANNLTTASTKGLDTLKDAGGLVEDAGETIRDYAKTAVDPEGIGEAVEGHLGQVNDYVEAVGGIAGEAVEGVMEVSQEIGEAATEISGAVIENFGEVSQDIVEGFENLESARDNILQGNIGESFGNISDGISNIVDGAQDLGKLGIEAIGEAVEGAAEITSEAVEAVGEIGREAIEAVPDIVENYINPSNSQDALENEQNLSQLPETLEKAQEAELQMQDSPLVERMGQAQETLEAAQKDQEDASISLLEPYAEEPLTLEQFSDYVKQKVAEYPSLRVDVEGPDLPALITAQLPSGEIKEATLSAPEDGWSQEPSQDNQVAADLLVKELSGAGHYESYLEKYNEQKIESDLNQNDSIEQQQSLEHRYNHSQSL
ncbi:hypothetical protein U2F10_01725 [Leptothoe sp. EHU-05/26/07-4]